MAPGRRRVFTGLALGLALPMASCAPPPGSARKTDITTIGGVSYRLPDGAFADGVVEHGPRDSLLLEMNAPGPVGEPLEAVQVLLNAPSTSSNARERAKEVRDSVALNAQIVAYNLGRQDKPLRRDKDRVLDAPAGLVQVAVDPSPDMDQDLFVRPPISNTIEYIACNRKKGYIVDPTCSQMFAGPGFTVKMSYRRELLSNWDSLRASFLSYLQNHRASR